MKHYAKFWRPALGRLRGLWMNGIISDFSPLQLSPVLWLDSSDSTTVFTDSGLTTPATVDGDSIGGWKDKSGNGRHFTQSSGTNRPTYKTAIRNGKAVIRFDGVNDRLTLGSDTGFPSGDMSVLAVCKCDRTFGSGSYSNVLVYGVASSYPADIGKKVYFLFGTDAFLGANGVGFSQYGDSCGTAGQVSAWKAFHACRTGSDYAIQVNGVTQATKTMTTNTVLGGSVAVGSDTSPGSYFLGDIAEILLFSRALGSNEIATLQSYFASKWSL